MSALLSCKYNPIKKKKIPFLRGFKIHYVKKKKWKLLSHGSAANIKATQPVRYGVITNKGKVSLKKSQKKMCIRILLLFFLGEQGVLCQ